jgi:hypothetical protein
MDLRQGTREGFQGGAIAMSDELVRKVRAAAGAAWCTVLIGALWLTVGYFLWLAILTCRPEWVRTLWGGGDLTWDDMQIITLWFFGVFKVILFVILFAAIWLSLWHRRLQKAE